MALTSDQIYLLNTLTYLTQDGISSPSEGMTVGDYAQTLLNNSKTREALTSGFQSDNDIITACERIMADKTVRNMEFTCTDKTTTNGDVFIITTPDGASQSQAVVVFEGTVGGLEWRDNFTGGTYTDADDGVSTSEQEKVLDWFESDEVSDILNQYDKVTVSGHSKGGNKAKYLALMNDNVDECVSFDGQGFSDEFVREYADAIKKNQHKIKNYNAQDDYVNILLNDVGEVIYIEGMEGNSFDANHSIFEMVYSYPFSDHVVEGNPILAELDQAMNGYLRTLSQEEKVVFLNLLGEITADALGGDDTFGWDDVGDYFNRLFIQGGLKTFTNFLEYLCGYVAYEAIEKIFDYVKKMFPFLENTLDNLLEKARKISGQRDGSDIRISGGSGADRIVVDTDAIRGISAKLRSLASEMQGCASQVSACADMCGENRIRLNLSFSLPMLFAGITRSVLSGILESLLMDLSNNMKKLAGASDDMASKTEKVASQIENTENKNVSGVPRTIGEQAPFANG